MNRLRQQRPRRPIAPGEAFRCRQRQTRFGTGGIRRFCGAHPRSRNFKFAGPAGDSRRSTKRGYALSLFGRAQDRLSHVLVPEPFESSWEFFYPTPYSRVITARDNKLVDTRDAQVVLAEIPFVSLRHGQPENLLEGKVRFSDSVSAVRAALGPAELTIDIERRRIRASGKAFRLPPAELALLILFARSAQAGKEPLAAPKKDVHDRQWGERYLAELRKVKGEFADLDKTEKALKNGMDGDFFSQTKSKLHNSLEKALGAASLPYLIDDSGTRPRRFRLKLGPEATHFAPVPD